MSQKWLSRVAKEETTIACTDLRRKRSFSLFGKAVCPQLGCTLERNITFSSKIFCMRNPVLGFGVTGYDSKKQVQQKITTIFSCRTILRSLAAVPHARKPCENGYLWVTP